MGIPESHTSGTLPGDALVRAATSAAAPAGGLIGARYHVINELGRGGMGTVYRVVDRLSGVARRALVEMEHPRAGKVKMVGVPVRLSDTPGSVRTPAPLLGEHTDLVLEDLLGLSAREVHDLRSAGVIGSASASSPR